MSIFENFASLLAWRLCISAFHRLDDILNPEDIEFGRQTLMRVSGAICNCSDRAQNLQLRYLDLEKNPRMLQGIANPQISDVHIAMINEALDEPPFSFERGPNRSFVLELKLYPSQLILNAINRYNHRALEVYDQFVQ